MDKKMAKLFKQSVYRTLASARVAVPAIPKFIQEYQTPKNEESNKINSVLVRIFDDEDLHTAVRAYGQSIEFAQYKPRTKTYNGFHHLVLDPTKRLVLVRQELQIYADHLDETELKHSNLFKTTDGVFYVKLRDGTAPGEPRTWKEGVLASNDMQGYEFCPNFDKKTALSSDQVLESLEQAIKSITK